MLQPDVEHKVVTEMSLMPNNVGCTSANQELHVDAVETKSSCTILAIVLPLCSPGPLELSAMFTAQSS